MITNKSDLKEYLNFEKRKIFTGSSRFLFLRVLLGQEKAIIYKFQKRLRVTEYHKNTGHKIRFFLSQILLKRLSNKTGLHIPVNTFGKGLKIMYLGSILVNSGSRIGENCSIHINTAIVARGREFDDSCPVLGDNIVIGVNAVILGNVKIANGIAIGAHALVNKSFLEENIAIAGVPAKKISDNGQSTWGHIQKSKI